MRWRARSLAVAAVVAVVAAACGGEDPAAPGGGDGGGAAGEIRVALAFDIGGLGDQSFNDSAYRGLQDAIADGLVTEENTDYLEPNASGSNREDNIANLTDQGYDLVFGVGYIFSPFVDELAKEYPDQYFGVVDGYSADAPNVTNLTFEEQDGSFLVGAAAALKSETGTIGFLGGQSGTGLIEKFEAGYAAGAQAVDPDIQVLVQYIGDTTAAFNDPTKGEALSAGMYDDGADVVYHAAGASGLGLFKAAEDAGQLAIGVDSDQSLTASPAQQELILTSMVKRVDTAVYDTIAAVADDQFVSGYQVFGFDDDGIDYAVNEFNDTEDLLSADIQAQLDEYKAQIISGDITVPEKP